MPATLAGMGDVVSMINAREKRAQLRRALAHHAVMHPALRWVTETCGRAHRRIPGGYTACGIPGPLTLADRDAKFCTICYPYWATIKR